MTIEQTIETAWEGRSDLSADRADDAIRAAVEQAIAGLDDGSLRVAQPSDSGWIVNEWLKKAVLLSFRLNDNKVMQGEYSQFFDKVPLKYADYSHEDFQRDGVRVGSGRPVSFVPPRLLARYSGRSGHQPGRGRQVPAAVCRPDRAGLAHGQRLAGSAAD